MGDGSWQISGERTTHGNCRGCHRVMGSDGRLWWLQSTRQEEMWSRGGRWVAATCLLARRLGLGTWP
jgi:hypothetical protein